MIKIRRRHSDGQKEGKSRKGTGTWALAGYGASVMEQGSKVKV